MHMFEEKNKIENQSQVCSRVVYICLLQGGVPREMELGADWWHLGLGVGH